MLGQPILYSESFPEVFCLCFFVSLSDTLSFYILFWNILSLHVFSHFFNAICGLAICRLCIMRFLA